MEKHNNIEYKEICVGMTRACGGTEIDSGEPAWRIVLHLKRPPWKNQAYTQVYLGNKWGWFVSGQEESVDRELAQLLEHIAAQKGLEVSSPGKEE